MQVVSTQSASPLIIYEDIDGVRRQASIQTEDNKLKRKRVVDLILKKSRNYGGNKHGIEIISVPDELRDLLLYRANDDRKKLLQIAGLTPEASALTRKIYETEQTYVLLYGSLPSNYPYHSER